MSKLDQAYQSIMTKAGKPMLLVTKEMMRQSRGNKVCAIFMMSAMDFLTLTTRGQGDIDHIMADAAPLATYNKAAREGNIILMPWLDVERDSGKVRGHEGRHRAAALIKAAGRAAKMNVGIILHGKSGIVYYEEKEIEGQPYFMRKKRFLGVEDVPRVLHGQFAPTVEVLSKRGARDVQR
jgi:hypothetical protein